MASVVRTRHISLVTATSSTSSLASRVLNWLRAGYPDGVPGADRVPLLSLLRSTPLTEEQVEEIVRTITASESEALAAGQRFGLTCRDGADDAP